LFVGYGEAATARSITGTLLRFSKGDFLAGQDGVDVPIGSRFVAIMDSLLVGWIRWENNAVSDHSKMGSVVEGFQPERRSDLGDHDKDRWEVDNESQPRDPWQFSNYLILHDVESGEVYTFATASKGGLGAIGELCKVYGNAMRQKPDQYPVVKLDVGSYQHRDRSLGRIKFPIFEIVDWVAKGGGSGTPVSEPPKSAAAPDKATTTKPAATKPAAAKATTAAQTQF
jgi:hypothetical protein